MLLTVVFFVSTVGINFFMTLAITARNVFGRGAESYGLLTSALAVGCLAGTFFAARRVGRPRLRTVLLAGLFFGVAELFTGVMPSYALTALLLVPTGLGQLVFTTAANAAVQLGVAESMRGRVMGLYMLVLLGGTPVGGPVLGWLAEVLGGPRAAGDRRGRDGRDGAGRRRAAGLAGPPARARPVAQADGRLPGRRSARP